MSFRKENKFRLSISDYYKVINLLISQGMIKLYEKRVINSLYYDTSNLNMFYDSEEGVLPRKKIRIRWYNKQKKFKIEKKISSVEGRYKKIISLEGLKKENNYLKNELIDERYGLLKPSLKVSYERYYFSYNKLRLTFDSNIVYVNPRISPCSQFRDPERVFEVKTEIDVSDDFIKKLLPFTTSRFSKYSRGIVATTNNL